MNLISTLKDLNWRYATKQFDTTKKINSEDLDELLETLRLAPSSFGLQPWKFVVVNDPKIREQLVAHSWGQKQVVEASHLIVLCARTDLNDKLIHKYIDSVSETRGTPKESLKTYADMMLGFRKNLSDEAALSWAKNQVYIALGFLLHACAIKKIDSCPMEGFDKAKYDEILGLKQHDLTAVVLCPVGYRHETDKYAKEKKVRFDKTSVIIKK